jgi:hypothetical protein
LLSCFLTASFLSHASTAWAEELTLEQITHGPEHHMFGYIGHVQNIPWNGSERYLLALRTPFVDHLPAGDEPADVVLIDAHDDYRVRAVDESRAWNPQQGTMFYWNPLKPDTQFFFNDRDPQTQTIFTVLFDIETMRRVREYRFGTQSIGNGGVMQGGGWFAGINYARLARLRPVTGYRGAADWTAGVLHPTDDGIFKVNVQNGEKSLLVSYRRMAEIIRASEPHVDRLALFVNHTLWNREDDRLFFFARAGWTGNTAFPRINVPFVVNADGSGLKRLKTFIGGHPEWDSGHRMIGALEGQQVVYDVDRDLVVEQLGDETVFPRPEGDIALSPRGDWLVNGHKDRKNSQNFYTFYHRPSGKHFRSPGVHIGPWLSGDLRLDPAPAWNRSGSGVLVPGLSGDDPPSRQLFLISLPPDD